MKTKIYKRQIAWTKNEKVYYRSRGRTTNDKTQRQTTRHNQAKTAKRRETHKHQKEEANGKDALLYSPLAETRLTVYRQREVKSNTGTVVASWDPRRRATIRIFDKKNKGFDEICKVFYLRISIFHLV